MNPYVLTWTLVSAAGVLLSFLLFVESALDMRALRGIGNGRRLYALGRAVSEVIRMVIHSAFLAIGLTVLYAPVASPSPIVIVLITGNVLLIVNSVIAWYVRHRAIAMDQSTASIEAEAVETALELRRTAARAAERLLELATLTANMGSSDRLAQAAERTAENTERIAENTDPANGAST